MLVITKKLFDWLLPATCVLCHFPSESEHNICRTCQQNLPLLTHHCQQCAYTLTDPQELLCHPCQQDPPDFTQIRALYLYEPPLIRLIIELKFRDRLSHTNLFASLFSQRIQGEWHRDLPLPHLIIPVPLHTQRLKKRGFNQSLEVAKLLSKQLGIPVDARGCERIKQTAAQSSLTAVDRTHNMRLAFKAKRHYTGLSVVVLDDVVTTTATVRALCKTLKEAGAKHVTVWCIARATMAKL